MNTPTKSIRVRIIGVALGIMGGAILVKIIYQGFIGINIGFLFMYAFFYVLYIGLVNSAKKLDD